MRVYWNDIYLKEQIKKGKNYLDIAKENNVGKSTIQRALNYYGLTKPSLDWTKKEISLLGKHYGSNRNFKKNFPNRTASSIYHKANRLRLENHIKPRKYFVNENFFKKWTKEMAYVLGWMFSDGNLAQDKRTFRIKLAIKDKEILEKIKRVLKSNAPIKILSQMVPSRKYTAKYALLRINSYQMCMDLIKLGCVPNKMHKFICPGMPSSLSNHFIRGYFDGDGSISFNKPNTIRIRIVSSNKKFIIWLNQTLKSRLSLPSNYKKASSTVNLWQCEYYGDNARNLCE